MDKKSRKFAMSDKVNKSQPQTAQMKAKQDYRKQTLSSLGGGAAVGGVGTFYAMNDDEMTRGKLNLKVPEKLDFKYKKANKPFAAYDKWAAKKEKYDKHNANTMPGPVKEKWEKIRTMEERGATPGERAAFGERAQKIENEHGYKRFSEPRPNIPEGAVRPVRTMIKHPKTVGTALGAAAVGGAVGLAAHLDNRHDYKQRFKKSHYVSAFGVEH